MAEVARDSMAEVAVEASMVADLAEDSTAVVSGGITPDGAGVAVGAVMDGAEVGAGTAADGVTRDGESESASALVGAGVRTGRVIRMPMATPTIRIPMAILTIRIIHIMGRRRMRPPIRMGITVAINIRMTTWSGRIRAIASRKDRPA